jgi:hypothetical protein
MRLAEYAFGILCMILHDLSGLQSRSVPYGECLLAFPGDPPTIRVEKIVTKTLHTQPISNFTTIKLQGLYKISLQKFSLNEEKTENTLL